MSCFKRWPSVILNEHLKLLVKHGESVSGRQNAVMDPREAPLSEADTVQLSARRATRHLSGCRGRAALERLGRVGHRSVARPDEARWLSSISRIQPFLAELLDIVWEGMNRRALNGTFVTSYKQVGTLLAEILNKSVLGQRRRRLGSCRRSTSPAS